MATRGCAKPAMLRAKETPQDVLLQIVHDSKSITCKVAFWQLFNQGTYKCPQLNSRSVSIVIDARGTRLSAECAVNAGTTETR